MTNKSLVKKRFQKSFKTYNENAIIQKKMSKKLINLLDRKSFNSILEIGSATGVLTEQIKKNLQFEKFTCNDIVAESKTYIDKILPQNIFLEGDIEEIEFNQKYDLIISNACLQWCNNLKITVDKLMKNLENNGILAISIFGNSNLKEINNIFELDNKNKSIDELKKLFEEYKIIFIEEEYLKIYFDSPIEILKHLKYTGVNAVKEMKLTKSKLQNFSDKYNLLYSENEKNYLTYNPIYLVMSKK
jgi:malonyl-CoA O-methyltransferase